MNWIELEDNYEDDEEEEDLMGRRVIHTGSGLTGVVVGQTSPVYLWVLLDDGSKSLIHSSELKDE